MTFNHRNMKLYLAVFIFFVLVILAAAIVWHNFWLLIGILAAYVLYKNFTRES